MPKGKKAVVSYGKALTSPGKRSVPRTHAAHKVPMNKPKGLSEIAEYVEENKEYRDSTLELVQEFQQEECDHERQRVVIAEGPSKKLLKCPSCGDIKEVLK